jgi:hypothetical protein
MKQTMILGLGAAALATLATTPATAQRWHDN